MFGVGVDLGLHRDAAVSVEEGAVSRLLFIPPLLSFEYGKDGEIWEKKHQEQIDSEYS